MKIFFSKYQGTGNDFVMIDNMNGDYDKISIKEIQFLCDRKLGIGGDGLIKLNSKEGYDFEVDYYNSDGTKSFCGNGARCSIAFAKSLQLIQNNAMLWAIDGAHKGIAHDNGIIEVEMKPVDSFIEKDDAIFMDTGSPHFIQTKSNLDQLSVVDEGRRIRYSPEYEKEGVNVNFMKEETPGQITVFTYERGVEDETLSCGTGVTACALYYMYKNNSSDSVEVITKGGKLGVRAERSGKSFDNIWLMGPAKKVFDGNVEI